jgi:hypothetical protein
LQSQNAELVLDKLKMIKLVKDGEYITLAAFLSVQWKVTFPQTWDTWDIPLGDQADIKM